MQVRRRSQPWTTNGQSRGALENVGPVIVEHWFYCGSCSPERRVFEDYDEFLKYLRAAKPGDAFHVWEFSRVCLDDNTLANGKYPDAQGRVPKGGAY